MSGGAYTAKLHAQCKAPQHPFKRVPKLLRTTRRLPERSGCSGKLGGVPASKRVTATVRFNERTTGSKRREMSGRSNLRIIRGCYSSKESKNALPDQGGRRRGCSSAEMEQTSFPRIPVVHCQNWLRGFQSYVQGHKMTRKT